jgi:hypothetical protein
VHEVLLHFEAPVAPEITADGAWCGGGRVRRSGQGPESLDDSVACDANRNDRSALHELDQRLKERLAFVLLVVLGEQLVTGLEQLDVDELVALRLDATQDLAGQVTGHSVWLHEDESFFDGHGVCPSVLVG